MEIEKNYKINRCKCVYCTCFKSCLKIVEECRCVMYHGVVCRSNLPTDPIYLLSNCRFCLHYSPENVHLVPVFCDVCFFAAILTQVIDIYRSHL